MCVVAALIAGTYEMTITNIDGNSFLTRGCRMIDKGDDIIINCTSIGLMFIPTLPKIANCVDLSKNNISIVIFATPFAGMTELRELDLSDNPLAYIPTNLFHGLRNLRKLVIRNSLLYEQKDLVLDSLLIGLSSLSHFSFTFMLPENTKFSPIPCEVKYDDNQPFGKVDSLQTVEVLEIDSALLKWKTVNSSNIINYRAKSLYLINGFVCYYGYLEMENFKNMPLLEDLVIYIPMLNSRVSRHFVVSQKHLKKLTIFGSNAPNGNAEDLIFNITASVSNLHNLSVLILNNISNDIRQKFYCGNDIYNLTKLTSLTHISIVGNSLSFAYLSECDTFPASLKVLNLRYNCLSSFDIRYQILSYNRQIEMLDAGEQSSCTFMNRFRTSNSSRRRRYTNDHQYRLKSLIFTNSSEVLDFGYDTDRYDHLKYLDLSLNNRNPGTIIPYYFSSARPNLVHFKMSNSRIFDLEMHSFSNFSKLEYLDLSSNMLGNMECRLSDSLSSLISLKQLDVANNRIQCIQPDIFHHMENIERVNLSLNEIHTIDAELDKTKTLKYLDLSNNRLQTLSESSRRQLNRLAGTHTIQVDLSDNVLLCTCETIDFLQWMKTTKVDLIKRDKYPCSYSNGSITHLNDILHIIDHLNSQCESKIAFIVSVSAVSAFVLVCTCGILSYKFRWKIRYLYYKAKIKIPYKTIGHSYEQIFEYDIFISYSSEDYEIARQGALDEFETKRNIHACIHERDFLAGESIALNISRGIRSSKRTVLFISNSFLASEWCMYELNIARMESLHTGRKVILVVMLESIANRTLPVDVLDLINIYTYLEYPRHGTKADIDVFWDKCADFVRLE